MERREERGEVAWRGERREERGEVAWRGERRGEGGEVAWRGGGKEEVGEKGKRKDVMIISKEVINQSTPAYHIPSLCETSCSTLQSHVCLTVLQTPLNKSL